MTVVPIRVEQEGEIRILIPEGEMVIDSGDLALREELERLHRLGNIRVVVDFSKVPYIDSSVLGQLVYGYSLLKKEGGDLKLLNLPARIMDLLEITRLVSVFEIFTDRSQAVRSWD